MDFLHHRTFAMANEAELERRTRLTLTQTLSEKGQDLLWWTSKRRFALVDDNGPLDQAWVFAHGGDEFVVTDIVAFELEFFVE